jgi:hypothetical protein
MQDGCDPAAFSGFYPGAAEACAEEVRKGASVSVPQAFSKGERISETIFRSATLNPGRFWSGMRASPATGRIPFGRTENGESRS